MPSNRSRWSAGTSSTNWSGARSGTARAISADRLVCTAASVTNRLSASPKATTRPMVWAPGRWRPVTASRSIGRRGLGSARATRRTAQPSAISSRMTPTTAPSTDAANRGLSDVPTASAATSGRRRKDHRDGPAVGPPRPGDHFAEQGRDRQGARPAERRRDEDQRHQQAVGRADGQRQRMQPKPGPDRQQVARHGNRQRRQQRAHHQPRGDRGERHEADLHQIDAPDVAGRRAEHLERRDAVLLLPQDRRRRRCSPRSRQ